MRKVTLLALTSIVTIGILTAPAPAQAETIATPKPGAACTDAGYFGIANGQMMTCVLSGSSLKWRLEKNVIADGSCVWWTNGDESTWEELQLFLGGKWVTQALPIAFTSGPFCDTTKSNSAIPWIALPSKIADGTKYRWIKGRSGKDGQGGREFAKGYADPVFTYTQAAMKRKNLKIYTAIVAPVYGPHAYALQKAKESAVTPTPVATPAPAPSPTPTPTVSPTPKPTPAPTQEPLTLSQFVAAAKSALSSTANVTPVLSSNPPKISTVADGSSGKFTPATQSSIFSFNGPKPISWTSGATSLIAENGQSNVYPANQGNLPPWAANFTVTTADANGKFVISTSGFPSSLQTYNWRLAYKKSGGKWEYASIAGTSHPATSNKFFDEITLGSAGTFDIRIELDSHVVFYGVSTDGTTQIAAATAKSTPRVFILGDSWVYPELNESGAWTTWDGFPGALTYLSGWNVISDGVRGQGYLRPSGGGTYKDRITKDVSALSPDVVIFTGSPNDVGGNFPADQIAAEFGRDILLMREKSPNSLLIVCSQFEGPADINQAMKAVAARLGVPYIDFITDPLFTQVNNGARQLSNGHPTRAGGPFIAQELLKKIAAL